MGGAYSVTADRKGRAHPSKSSTCTSLGFNAERSLASTSPAVTIAVKVHTDRKFPISRLTCSYRLHSAKIVLLPKRVG